MPHPGLGRKNARAQRLNPQCMLAARLSNSVSCVRQVKKRYMGSHVHHMREMGRWEWVGVETPTTEAKAVFFRAEEHTSHRVSLVLLRQSFPSGSILSRKRNPTILCSSRMFPRYVMLPESRLSVMAASSRSIKNRLSCEELYAPRLFM